MNPAFPVVLVGQVDSGKSTLLARILIDTGTFPMDRLEELKTASARRGSDLELSFMLDAFQSERDQAVTIDSTKRWFRTAARAYVFTDAPGHRQFLKALFTGAAESVAALLVCDVREALPEDAQKQIAILRLWGISDFVVALNKMDLTSYAAGAYAAASARVRDLLAAHDARAHAVVPVAAKSGDNVAEPSDRTPWYDGPTLIEALDTIEIALPGRSRNQLIVQDVYRRNGDRIVTGWVESGRFAPGDNLIVLPSNAIAHIAELRGFPQAPAAFNTGDHAAITLDRPIFVEPGDVLAEPGSAPAVATTLGAAVFWFAEGPLEDGAAVDLRIGARDVGATVMLSEGDRSVGRFELANIDFELRGPAVLDLGAKGSLSKFALYRGGTLSGCAVATTLAIHPREISSQTDLAPERSLATLGAVRSEAGHSAGVLWLTGLPAAGKSTIATQVEQRLFERGWRTIYLDGDSLRAGISRDLGFSPADRNENVRRAAEIAKLFVQSGNLAIVALVSPSASARTMAREIIGNQFFHEIYIDAPLDVCRQRDPKGLYLRAEAQSVPNFTGISASYEPPPFPDLRIASAVNSIDLCVAQLFGYAIERFERS